MIFLALRDRKAMQKSIEKERMGHVKVPKYIYKKRGRHMKVPKAFKNDEHMKAHRENKLAMSQNKKLEKRSYQIEEYSSTKKIPHTCTVLI